MLLRPGLLVVCEVKTRTTDRFGTPAEAVTPRQLRRVRAAAGAFLGSGALAATSRPRAVRFDVACVDATGVVEVIEGVT